MAQLKPIDLNKFKGLFEDLNEIGLALALDQPGQEAVGRARKALARLESFLKADVAEPTLGMISNIKAVATGLDNCGRGGLFAAPPDLTSVREAHQRLRAYIEALEKAWMLCLMAPAQADRAARRRLAG